MRCSSSDSTKISFEGIDPGEFTDGGSYYYWMNGTIKLRNLAGGKIQITKLEQDGYFYGNFLEIGGKVCGDIDTSNTVEIGAGTLFEVTPPLILWYPSFDNRNDCDTSTGEFNVKEGNIYITYNDQTGLERNVIIACHEFPPKPIS